MNPNAPTVPPTSKGYYRDKIGCAMHPELLKELCNNTGCSNQQCPQVCSEVLSSDGNDYAPESLPVAPYSIIGHSTTNKYPLSEDEQQTKQKYPTPEYATVVGKNGKKLGGYTVMYDTSVPIEQDELSNHGTAGNNSYTMENGPLQTILENHNKRRK